MRKPNTGKLNQLIDIYSQTNISDGHGGGADENESYWQTNAEIKQLRSARTLEANQDNLQAVFQFTVRAREDKDIFNDMLVNWRNQWYVIQNYTPDVIYKQFVTFDGSLQDMGNIMTLTT